MAISLFKKSNLMEFNPEWSKMQENPNWKEEEIQTIWECIEDGSWRERLEIIDPYVKQKIGELSSEEVELKIVESSTCVEVRCNLYKNVLGSFSKDCINKAFRLTK